MPFAEFMQQALYDPEFGYYTANSPKFGIIGDFITAPEMTPLFGHTLGIQCAAILQSLTNPIIFEFGAGTGRLCVDILIKLEQLNCLPQAYWILEVSGNLRARQQRLIMELIPHLHSKIHWLTRWPEHTFNGIILANEVVDAMPVQRFGNYIDGLKESFISLDATASCLIEEYKPCTNSALWDYVHPIIAPDLIPYNSEVNLIIHSWLKECSEVLACGVLIIIDYGFPRSEYYHPNRNHGTLMCHYQHQTQHNPLINIGQQDITAHVEFTLVAEAAAVVGFKVAGYTSQAAFLLSCGILNLLEPRHGELPQDTRTYLTATQAVKKLIEPHEMGEIFKVIALTKNYHAPLQGFILQDRRITL